eukprot:768570-Hanusia_phi.AAC.5
MPVCMDVIKASCDDARSGVTGCTCCPSLLEEETLRSRRYDRVEEEGKGKEETRKVCVGRAEVRGSRVLLWRGGVCLLTELAMVYASDGTPLRVLEGYLSAITIGRFQNYNESAFSDQDMQTSNLKVSIRWMIEMFEVEAVLIWSCMMLKKR